MDTNPAGLNLSVSTIYDADIGVKVAVLGEDLIDQDFPLPLEAQTTIFNQFYASNGSGGVTVQ